MTRIRILIGVISMVLGILLLLAGSHEMNLSSFGSCLVLGLLLNGLFFILSGIRIPERTIGR